MSDYRAEWQEYRRRRKVYSVVLWGFLPFGGFAAVSEFSPIAARSKLTLPLVLVYVALYFYVAVRVSRWPCPQCKRAFCSVFVIVGNSIQSVSTAVYLKMQIEI